MNLAVVLVSTRNPLNIGAAARAAANFGFDDLRLVNPYEKAFRESPSAAGGARVLETARIYKTVADAVGDCELVIGTTSIGHRALQHSMHSLETAPAILRGYGGRAALLFGSEKFGLSNDDLSFCHSLVRIPTVPETPSMNLGQAVAVCLYELAREPQAAPSTNPPQLVAGNDAEQLTRMLLDVLTESGYTNRIIAISTERKIRRFVRRVQLRQRDARLVLGILRQLLWKMRE